MGADNLATFDRWQRWRWIMDNVPIAVLARPGQALSERRSRAAQVYRRHRLRSDAAMRLCAAELPAWCFINVPMVDISSTEIRARGDWRR
jgi:nicotinate-nucleotide adenylyltransferase